MEFPPSLGRKMPSHLRVIGSSLEADHTVYHINVKISEDISWIVTHRYKDFYKLHEKLVSKFGLPWELLPPRKLVGNLQPMVVDERKTALQDYLSNLLSILPDFVVDLQEFLDVECYDVYSVCKRLAVFAYEEGDEIIKEKQPFELSPFQIHCINRRLLLPSSELHGIEEDISHLYSFLHQLSSLKINGGGRDDSFSGTNDLTYDVSLFKSLEHLEMTCCDIELMLGIEKIQHKLTHLWAKDCLVIMKDLFIGCDSWHEGLLVTVQEHSQMMQPQLDFPLWEGLTDVNLSSNEIQSIDFSLMLLPNVKRLNLSSNLLIDIDNLEGLVCLLELDLSHNHLQGVTRIAQKLSSSVTHLTLAGNHLQHVADIPQMKNLLVLNLSDNELKKIEDVLPLGRLENLQQLDLRENPVSELKGYRVSLISQFDAGQCGIVLDNRKAGKQEGRKVSRMQAEMENFEVIVNQDSPHSSSSASCVEKHSRRKEHSVEIKGATTEPDLLRGSCGGVLKEKFESLRHAAGDSWLTLIDNINNDSTITTQTDSKKEKDDTRDLATVDCIVTVAESSEDDCSYQENFRRMSLKANELPANLPLRDLISNLLSGSSDLFEESFLVKITGSVSAFEYMVAVDNKRLLQIDYCTGNTIIEYGLDSMTGVGLVAFDEQWKIEFHYKDEEGMTQSASFYSVNDIDAAGLYVILHCFLNGSLANQCEVPTPRTSLRSSSSNFENPFGFSEEMLISYFQTFVRGMQVQDEKQRSTSRPWTRSASVKSQKPVLVASQDVLLTVWAGCLAYVHPEEEFPSCLVMTNSSIYLYRVLLSNNNTQQNLPATLTELHGVLQHFFSCQLIAIKEIVVGLYDQTFRIEVHKEGPNGTFTFLTRDASHTSQFLEMFCSLSNVNSQDDGAPAIVYPDEGKIEALKNQLIHQNLSPLDDRENLIIYCIVYESSDFSVPSECRVRSLVLTNARLLLCQEDHIHWPLPTFARKPPVTPKWVVENKEDLTVLIGIDVWEKTFGYLWMGSGYGVTLLFEDSLAGMTSHHDKVVCKTWQLLFYSLGEREQFIRSLSCLWTNHFDGSLAVTHSNVLLTTANPSSESRHNNATSQGHRRVPSGGVILVGENQTIDSLQVLCNVSQPQLQAFFKSKIATNSLEADCTVCCLQCTVISYVHPQDEFSSAVIVAGEKVYLVCDKENQKYFKFCRDISSNGSHSNLCCYTILVTELLQVVVGLFDQTIRMEGHTPETTVTLLTRSHEKTSKFLEVIRSALAMNTTNQRQPSIDPSLCNDGSTIASDIVSYYSQVHAGSPFSESCYSEAGIHFVYPSDDTLDKLKYHVASKCEGTAAAICNILLYSLIYIGAEGNEVAPCTLVITESVICLIKEDHVHYPLPLFAVALPEDEQYKIVDCFPIAAISHVEIEELTSCDFTVVVQRSGRNDNINEGGNQERQAPESNFISYLDCCGKQDMWQLHCGSFEERESILGMLSKMWSTHQQDCELQIAKCNASP